MGQCEDVEVNIREEASVPNNDVIYTSKCTLEHKMMQKK